MYDGYIIFGLFSIFSPVFLSFSLRFPLAGDIAKQSPRPRRRTQIDKMN